MKKIFFMFLLLSIASINVFAQEEAQQFEGFNLQGYTDGGEKAWDVNGDTADIDGNTIKITNVDANRYGDQKMNLKAKTGIIDKDSGDIQLEKDVVITTETGSQLKTDSLNWEKENDLVITEDSVVLTDKDMVATGKGLQARPGLQTATLTRDVSVKVLTELDKHDGSVVNITCDGPLEIDQKKNMATLRDNVVAIQEDKTLKADLMEIYFDAETAQIRQMVCIGNVHIIQGDNHTLSDKAVYNAATQKLILSGRPKLTFATEGNKGGVASFK